MEGNSWIPKTWRVGSKVTGTGKELQAQYNQKGKGISQRMGQPKEEHNQRLEGLEDWLGRQELEATSYTLEVNKWKVNQRKDLKQKEWKSLTPTDLKTKSNKVQKHWTSVGKSTVQANSVGSQLSASSVGS